APVTIPLAALGQVAKFLAEIFPNLPQPFHGVLRISSNANIAVVGLRGRYNERTTPGPDFLITTTPPTLESAAASNAGLLLPHHRARAGVHPAIFCFSRGRPANPPPPPLLFLTTDEPFSPPS